MAATTGTERKENLDFTHAASVHGHSKAEAAIDADYNELARHLLVLATEMIEAAHETATAGQANDTAASDCVASARALCRQAEQLSAIARAILVAIEPKTDPNQTDPSC